MSFLPVAMEHRSIGKLAAGRQTICGKDILYTNDVDYQAARVLASKIITEEPFEEISDNTYKNAENMIDQCQIVVNAGVHIGSCNHRMRNLLQYAQEKGKLKRDYL